MSEVLLQGIVKAFGPFQVIHGVDIEIRPKEFVVLVGPSGCGKSTCLRMIAGLEEITAGKLAIGGRVMNQTAPKNRDVAMVFQDYALYPHLNVADNIAFGLRLRKVPKPEIAESVKEVAATLGLTPYLDRRPANLSGGQRQRVAMGRAIVRRPKVFLFDEPLSNLDAQLRTQMRAEIKRLHKRLGVTSIYVTHDQTEAMTLADRIVVMEAGRIQQAGAPMDLFNNPVNTFVAGFIGSPPMNQLPAVIEAGDTAPAANIAGQRITLPGLKELEGAAGREVIVGIRPEHVSVGAGKGGNSMPVTLDLVETLGSEALLHTQIGGVPFVAKVETHGETAHLSGVQEFNFQTDLIEVFDGKTKKAYGRAAET